MDLSRYILPAIGLVFLCSTSLVAQKRKNKKKSGRDPLQALSSEHLQDDLRLTTRQKRRVRELLLQFEGARALRRPEIAKSVGLRMSQVKQIEEIFEGQRQKLYEYYRLRKTDRVKAKLLSKELNQDVRAIDARVLDVLSSSQRRRFEKMLGEPFDRSKLYEPKKKRSDV